MRKKTTHPKGSILIMTFVLGLSLTAVFFAFSQSLTLNARTQKKSMNKQSSELLLESYVDYIQGLPLGDLEAIRDAGDISFESITGTLTNEVEEITGVVDAGANITYTSKLPSPSSSSDGIKVLWDPCPLDATEILIVNPTSIAAAPSGCGLGEEYAMSTQTTNPLFTLTATAGPVNYKLEKMNNATLYDNKWQLDLEISLGFRKKLTANRIFTPSP